jgi:hypothetical protein
MELGPATVPEPLAKPANRLHKGRELTGNKVLVPYASSYPSGPVMQFRSLGHLTSDIGHQTSEIIR